MRAGRHSLLALVLLACGPPAREGAPLELETVEVGRPVDAELSTEEDEKGRPPSDSGWILTGMLPDDLPLHRPARLVGSGDTGDGRAYYLFHTSTAVERVRSGLTEMLEEAGWSARTIAGGLRAVKGSDEVEFSFSPLDPGTVIRVVY